MVPSISKKIEVAANIAIIAVACLLATVLVKNHLINKPTQPAAQTENQADTPTLSALDIDWRQNKQTLLLVVSTTCHFCTESAPFYKELVKARGRTRLIALLPQPVDEGTRYLESIGVLVDEVKQVSANELNVRGTPTLILVDSEGAITNTWIGKLMEEQQQEVFKRVL